MKKIFLSISIALAITGFVTESAAQVINPGRRIKEKGEQRTNDRIDKTLDKGMDKIDEGIDNLFNGKKKKKDKANNDNSNDGYESDNAADNANGSNNNYKTNNTTSGASTNNNTSNAKFDFVPGTEVIYTTDFSNEAMGDFPVDFNTNASGEVVTINGKSGKWLSMNKNGAFIPDNIKNLPDNFTLEFDAGIIGEPSNNYSGFGINFTTIEDELMKDVLFHYGSVLWMHAGAEQANIGIYPESGATAIENEIKMNQWNITNKNFVRVSIWRQKGRLRVYIGKEKVVDVPRFFVENKPYNLAFFRRFFEDCELVISNIRFAHAGADMRTKFMSEGRFSTNEILFDVNSDVIKKESTTTIKEIAALLQENTSVKMKIVGHTDSDGEANANVALSKKRAESVKNKLISEYGIAASRLSTDGKGASQPIESNGNAAGKAKNRRVEFIKM